MDIESIKNTVIQGNNLDVLPTLPDNSVDAIVTDPPYGLSFMGKKRDYDVPSQKLWEECLRVLKPGGYLLAFAGTRTQHRMAVRIEDAGFEIRDMIAWVYGCLSEDTEILTKDGRKHYNKITGNSPVYCYNVDKDIFEYHLPTNYFLYENKHIAYRIQSDNTDQIVSRNHRVAVEQDGRIVFKYAETLKQQENIPILESVSEMGETIGNEYKRTSYKEQILLGLCMKSYIREKEMKTEGYKLYVGEEMGGMLKSIYDEEEQTLKVLLEQMQLNSEMKGISEALAQVKELMDRTIQTIIQSKDVMTELQVLEELRNSYEEEMKVCKSNDKICKMSDGLYGDGKKGLICNGTQTNCCKGNEKTTNENGVCSSHKSQCRGQQNGKPDVIQDELRTQEIGTLKRYTTTSATITEIEYDGYVWCVEVPTGCFVARRNGKIFITGNSGFPKSLNIGKAIDKLQGNEREVTRVRTDGNKGGGANTYDDDSYVWDKPFEETKGTSEREGRGTALKPALEPITMARKPLAENTVAENVLKWGTGGINIDGSRVGTEDNTGRPSGTDPGMWAGKKQMQSETNPQGRFPANLIHDGSDEVVELFPNTKSQGNRSNVEYKNPNKPVVDFGGGIKNDYNDAGSASRFFMKCEYTEYDIKNGNSMLNHYTMSDLSHKQSLWKTMYVSSVELLLKAIQAIKESTALLIVDDLLEENLNHYVKSAEKNANYIEILTALGLVKIKSCDFSQEVLQAIHDYTGNSKECILILNLVKSVELNENTDITEITTNLLKSFGSALLATEENINYERSENDDLIAEGQRFLYQAKASKSERNMGCEELPLGDPPASARSKPAVGRENALGNPRANNHPTVKPIALMEYLVKLVSKEGAIVLDPFAGSGSTLIACKRIDRQYIGIEMTEEYIPIIEARLNAVVKEEPEQDLQPSLF